MGDNLENNLDQHCPMEFSVMTEMFYICVVQNSSP